MAHIFTGEVPRGEPEEVSEAVLRVSRSRRLGLEGVTPEEFTEQAQRELGRFTDAPAGETVLSVHEESYDGVQVTVGSLAQPPLTGLDTSLYGGVYLHVDNAHQVKTPGDPDSARPTLQIGHLGSPLSGHALLLGTSWANPLASLRRYAGTTRVGEDQIGDYVDTLRAPHKLAALTVLGHAGVEVDCVLDDEAQEAARQLLYWAVARFAVYHGNVYASKYTAESLIAANRVLQAGSAEIKTEAIALIKARFEGAYARGLRRRLTREAVAWLAEEMQQPEVQPAPTL